MSGYGFLPTNSEFCDDLLSACIRRGLRRDGFPPIKTEYSNDGSVTCTFGGYNARRQYIEKQVSFRALLPTNPSTDEIAAAANPDVLADACGEAIADIESTEKKAGFKSGLGWRPKD